MTDAERMLTEDAIECAIRAERKVVILERWVRLLGLISVILLDICFFLIIRG